MKKDWLDHCADAFLASIMVLAVSLMVLLVVVVFQIVKHPELLK